LKAARIDYPAPFQALARQLRNLPGIGSRSAERIALYLTTSDKATPDELSASIQAAAKSLKSCQNCGFFATDTLCEICQDQSRHGKAICVVERSTDVLPIERSGAFDGLYHVLGGRLSPLDHIGPEDLRITELLDRLEAEHPQEIILALSADVEGEATTSYLAEVIRPSGIKVTRIAHGLPAGGGLDHADPLTLQRALSGRN